MMDNPKPYIAFAVDYAGVALVRYLEAGDNQITLGSCWSEISFLVALLSDEGDSDLVAVDPCKTTSPVGQAGRGQQQEKFR